jgi:hypothetical protein
MVGPKPPARLSTDVFGPPANDWWAEQVRPVFPPEISP